MLVKEVFGAGTACVICSVKDILYENQVFHRITITTVLLTIKYSIFLKISDTVVPI